MATSTRKRVCNQVPAAVLGKNRSSFAAVLGIALLVMALFLAGCGVPVNYTVSGKVTEKDGTPVSGVTISFGSQGAATTGSDGTWTKSGLNGPVTVKAAKSEFAFTPEFKMVTGFH